MVATIITITVVLIITLLYVLAKKAKKANHEWTFSGDTRLQKRKYGLAMDLYGAMGVDWTDGPLLRTRHVMDAIWDGAVEQFLNGDDHMEAYYGGGFAQERLEENLLEAMWDHEFEIDITSRGDIKGKEGAINMTHVVEVLFDYCYPEG